MLSDVSGILDGKGKLVPQLDKSTALDLMEKGVIRDGMAVKVEAALHAAETLGKPVCVASWRYPDQLLKLLAGGAVGTQVAI